MPSKNRVTGESNALSMGIFSVSTKWLGLSCRFGFLDARFYLAMDRTNWQWGKKNLNTFMLAVLYNGVAISIYWLLLNKKGNSDTRERIAIVKRFIKQFGKERLLGILADREFIGEQWLRIPPKTISLN